MAGSNFLATYMKSCLLFSLIYFSVGDPIQPDTPVADSDTITVFDCNKESFKLTISNSPSASAEQLLDNNVVSSDTNGFASAVLLMTGAKRSTLLDILRHAQSDSVFYASLVSSGAIDICNDPADPQNVDSALSEAEPVAANGYLDDESGYTLRPPTRRGHHQQFIRRTRTSPRMFHTDQIDVKIGDILPGKKGVDLFQGDMVYTRNFVESTKSGDSVIPTKDTMYWKPWNLWPRGKVNWYIDSAGPAVDECAIATFNTSASYMEKYTCLRFNYGVKPMPGSTYSIKLTADGNTCWAFVGMDTQSQVNLGGSGCQIPGIALHELGHAVGLIHQHSRDDRDKYVTIDWSNIKTSATNNFYKIISGSSYDSAISNLNYDYTSIMHYGMCEFSTDSARSGNCMRTIDPADESVAGQLGQRDHLSQVDIDTINSMYGCTATCGDGIQNQGEEGVDCGGPCRAQCGTSNDGIIPLPPQCAAESSELTDTQLAIIAGSAALLIIVLVIVFIVFHNKRKERKELAKQNLTQKSRLTPEQLREVLRQRKSQQPTTTAAT
jgi:hypothetical protein